MLAAQLEGCGLLTEGEVGPNVLARFYAPTACYQECLGSATCEELDQLVCGGALELRRRCDQRCAFRCGDGTLIAVEQRCDGWNACADGADEAGCEMWTCRDGAQVPAARRCDRGWHCPDGSDEEGCGWPTRCDDGRPLSTWDLCDGYAACFDGADERGCPQHVCDDGTVITTRIGAGRCDGWSQCPDGSDERDCANVRASCF